MFVKQFLNDYPDGTTKTVNEAWQAARFEGTISPTLVNKTRVKMNLTGNLRGNSKTAAEEKSAHRLPKTATFTPGKTSFLKSSSTTIPKATSKRPTRRGRQPDSTGPSAKPSSTRREHRWV